MTPGTYTHGHASLKVNVAKALPHHMRGHVYELTTIRTAPEFRGNGDATTLLLQTCLEADLAGKFLMVCVEPDEDSPLDEQALVKFYTGFGFRPFQEEPALLMVRPCISRINYAKR